MLTKKIQKIVAVAVLAVSVTACGTTGELRSYNYTGEVTFLSNGQATLFSERQGSRIINVDTRLARVLQDASEHDLWVTIRGNRVMVHDHNGRIIHDVPLPA